MRCQHLRIFAKCIVWRIVESNSALCKHVSRVSLPRDILSCATSVVSSLIVCSLLHNEPCSVEILLVSFWQTSCNAPSTPAGGDITPAIDSTRTPRGVPSLLGTHSLPRLRNPRGENMSLGVLLPVDTALQPRAGAGAGGLENKLPAEMGVLLPVDVALQPRAGAGAGGVEDELPGEMGVLLPVDAVLQPRAGAGAGGVEDELPGEEQQGKPWKLNLRALAKECAAPQSVHLNLCLFLVSRL